MASMRIVSLRMDEYTQRYTAISAIPLATSGRIHSPSAVSASFSACHAPTATKSSTTNSWFCDGSDSVTWSSFPVATRTTSATPALTATSDDGSLIASLFNSKEKGPRIEIARKNGSLAYAAALGELHGDIVSDQAFATLVWSPDASRLVWVAEPKSIEPKDVFAPASDSVSKPKSAPDAKLATEQVAFGIRSKYEFSEDWGEVNTGVARPQLYLLDVAAALGPAGAGETASHLAIDGMQLEGLGQACFSPDGSHLVFGVVPAASRRLGLVYCSNRAIKLYAVAVPAQLPDLLQPLPLPTGVFRAEAPIFTPAGDELVYLARTLARSHRCAAAVCALPWPAALTEPASSPRTVVATRDMDLATDGELFTGIYGDSLAPASGRAWLNATTLLVTTLVRSSYRVVVIDLAAATATVLPPPRAGTCTLLDVAHGHVLVASSSPATPSTVFITALDSSASAPDWVELASPSPSCSAELAAALSDITCTTELVACTDDSGEVFEAHLLYSEAALTAAGPDARLIVNPHGGPHSCYPDSFDVTTVFYLLSGYAVIKPNYRGSTGFGNAFVAKLPGHVGDMDVADVQAATAHALAAPALSAIPATNVFLVGGSHGGFLSGHSALRFGGTYAAAALRNPVTNIATMLGATDIPDWCWDVIGRAPLADEPVSGELLAAAFAASPMAHVAAGSSVPMIIMIGLNDRRVPPPQGTELYYALRARGVAARLLHYPDNTHALNKPAAAADREVHTLLFFDDVLSA
ncbi:acylamino-acid-releasing enzyme [Thecamonas trahens ATCC 50062]|uniref:acylaminoacyl-peptidase n=1 Tax=Thecamonas trahens ATCC 50062 TaxID=461836 RepID=A0A0L0D733_THETB|nr:acylamino-acid-releasing enzyme [Thecamonas trahens ATCC 50062]KNC47911.1 acylamino-acid-releasing enzyme [Thecamonas trahens ATCC 50062]|eukprot:XP_013758932.1 acylamino-acid-releasing enzyme [Thecamonas trahens ATCC 50062]